MTGAVGTDRSTAVTERLAKLWTYARVPAASIVIPRGALPGISPAATAWRSQRTSVLGPATRGFPTVGTPVASTVRRTRTSEFWITAHASEPSGRHAIATGFERKSRGAGVVPRL